MDFHLLKYELEGEESEASMAFQSLGMQRSPLLKTGTVVWNHRSQGGRDAVVQPSQN